MELMRKAAEQAFPRKGISECEPMEAWIIRKTKRSKSGKWNYILAHDRPVVRRCVRFVEGEHDEREEAGGFPVSVTSQFAARRFTRFRETSSRSPPFASRVSSATWRLFLSKKARRTEKKERERVGVWASTVLAIRGGAELFGERQCRSEFPSRSNEMDRGRGTTTWSWGGIPPGEWKSSRVFTNKWNWFRRERLCERTRPILRAERPCERASVDGRNKAALSFVSTIQPRGGYNASVLIKTDRPNPVG